MKNYVTPEIEIQTVTIADIITLSLLGFIGLGNNDGYYDSENDNNSDMDI